MTKKFNKSARKKELHKLWAEHCKERDNGSCQWCGKRPKPQGLHAHHVVSVGISGNAGRFEIENSMALCMKCHIYRLKDDVDGYIRFRDDWLMKRGLNYFDMRRDYQECHIKFTEDFYNQKLKGLEGI